MNANDVIADGRVDRIRELKAEVACLSAELSATKNALASWERHFEWAVVAVRDADRMTPDGRIVVVDGWNFQLGSRGRGGVPAVRRGRAVDAARRHLAANPHDFVWVVFDGPRENAEESADARLRIYFTGGEGSQRADRAICDYLRMLRLAGRNSSVILVTDDDALRRQAASLGAEILPADSWGVSSCSVGGSGMQFPTR